MHSTDAASLKCPMSLFLNSLAFRFHYISVFFFLQVSMEDLGLWTRGKFSSNGKAGFLNRPCNGCDFCKVASAVCLTKKEITLWHWSSTHRTGFLVGWSGDPDQPVDWSRFLLSVRGPVGLYTLVVFLRGPVMNSMGSSTPLMSIIVAIGVLTNYFPPVII